MAAGARDAAAGERWRHFGVVDVAGRRVVEKPTEPLGSTWCWGAAWWTAAFTDRLRTENGLLRAIGTSDTPLGLLQVAQGLDLLPIAAQVLTDDRPTLILIGDAIGEGEAASDCATERAGYVAVEGR